MDLESQVLCAFRPFSDTSGSTVPLDNINEDEGSQKLPKHSGSDPLILIYQNHPFNKSRTQAHRNSGGSGLAQALFESQPSKRDLQTSFLREDDGTAWTAVKCLRLLRPLRAALYALRRDDYPISKAGLSLGSKQDHFKCSESVCEMEDEGELSISAAQIARDPKMNNTAEYVPMSSMAMIKRTYSTRQRPRRVNYCDGVEDIPDASFLPSRARIVPVQLSRPRSNKKGPGGDPDVENGDLGSLTSAKHDAERKANLKALSKYRKNRVTDGKYKKIFHAFDHLIQATCSTLTSPDSVKASGASSLFATCLNQLPQRISQLQELAESRPAEDQDDAVTDIYQDLNQLSSNETAGWRPLKGLVRSHAVYLLSDAVRDGLLTSRAILSHVAVCEAGDFTSGSHQILRAWGDAIVLGNMENGHVLSHADMLSTRTRSMDCQYIFWTCLAEACKAGVDAFPKPRDAFVSDRCLWPYKAGCAADLFSASYVRRESAVCLVESMISCAVAPLMLDFGEFVQAHRSISYGLQPKEMMQRSTNGISESDEVSKKYSSAISSIMTYIATVSMFAGGDPNPGRPVLQRLLRHSMNIISFDLVRRLDSYQKFMIVAPWLSSLFVLLLDSDMQQPVISGKEAFLDLIGESEDYELQHLLADHVIDMAKNCSMAAGQFATIYANRSEVNLTFREQGLLAMELWPSENNFDIKRAKSYLQQMVRGMMMLARIEQVYFFLRLATDAACDWADLTEATADIKFAKKITEEGHEIYHRNTGYLSTSDDEEAPSTPHSEVPERNGESYRWEDSISSWVIESPRRHMKNANLQVVVPALSDVKSPSETKLSIRSLPQPSVIVPAVSDVAGIETRPLAKRTRSQSVSKGPNLRRRLSNPGFKSGLTKEWRASNPYNGSHRVVRRRIFTSRRLTGTAVSNGYGTDVNAYCQAQSSDSEDELA